jgi:hypothetical protein
MKSIYGALIAAVAFAAAPLAQQSRTSTPDGPPSGIFLEVTGGEPIKLPASTTMDVEMQGIGASAATFGIVKPKQLIKHAGARAETVVTSAQPSFLFRFPPPGNQRDPYAMMAAMSDDGLPYMSTEPKQFMLIMATVEDDQRVFDSKKVIKGKVAIQKLGPREFRVTVSEPLKPGEWAFFLADQRRGGGFPTQIWAFSYRPE